MSAPRTITCDIPAKIDTSSGKYVHANMEEVDIEIQPLGVYIQEVSRICDPEERLREHLQTLTDAIQTYIDTLTRVTNAFQTRMCRESEDGKTQLDMMITFYSITRQDLERVHAILTCYAQSETLLADMLERGAQERYPTYYLLIPECADVPDYHISKYEVEKLIPAMYIQTIAYYGRGLWKSRMS